MSLGQLSRGIGESRGMGSLARGNDDGAAPQNGLAQLSRKPNQNKWLSEIANILLQGMGPLFEAGAGFDHVMIFGRLGFTRTGRIRIAGEQLVNTAEDILQSRRVR